MAHVAYSMWVRCFTTLETTVRKYRALTLAAGMFMFAGMVQAHAHLEKATPADNSIVAAVPSGLMLHFSEATRLTAVSIQKEGEGQPVSVSVLPKKPPQR